MAKAKKKDGQAETFVAAAPETLVAHVAMADEDLAADAALLDLDAAKELPASFGGMSFKDLEKDEEDEAPGWNDPGWGEYVMSKMEPSEKTSGGRPFVHGLRRMVSLLVGDVVESASHVVQAPSFLVHDGKLYLQPAVVEHEVVVNAYKQRHAGTVRYKDAADVSYLNAESPFDTFPTAFAATRAEARCFRKLLKLKGAAAEEMAEPGQPKAEAGPALVSKSQLRLADAMAQRIDLDVGKLVEIGKAKMEGSDRYTSVRDMKAEVGDRLFDKVSEYQNDPAKIPEGLRGYKKGWCE